MEFAFEKLPVHALLDHALELNRPFAAEYGITLEVVPPAVEGLVAVDPDRFHQLMSNLVSNAVKYSPAGGVVTLSAEIGSDSAVIAVADDGPGIPEEFRPFVFERFTQADASPTRSGQGTGLGLYISRLIVERLAGRIRFDSELGRGTTFYVELPLVATDSGPFPAFDEPDSNRPGPA
jgi:signal transduction histidine kinase